MKQLNFFIDKLFDKKIDGTGLAVFRMAYSIVLLCEIAQLYYFRHLIFDKIPYLNRAEINFGIPISIWFISVLFILFGAFTRLFTVLNYVLGLIIIGSIHTYEYHVFYTYMGINFLFMFTPVSQCLSLDRLFKKLKYSDTSFQYNPINTVSQFYYLVLPFVGIGLVYFDSIFIKITAFSWQNGLGVWMPASFPMMTHVNTSIVLNFKHLMLFLGYFTLFFETIFVFVFWRKRWRIFTVVSGIGLHLGILIVFPIPWFALTVSALYLLVVPVSFWQKFLSVNRPKSSLVFYYDTKSLQSVRAMMIIRHLDWFHKIEFKNPVDNLSNQKKSDSVDQEVVLNKVHCMNRNGKVFLGVDKYIEVLKRIFYLAPLGYIMKLPGIYQVIEKLYSYISKEDNSNKSVERNNIQVLRDFSEDAEISIFNNISLKQLKIFSFKFLMVFFIFLQLLFIYKSPSLEILFNKLNYTNTFPDKVVNMVYNKVRIDAKTYFGITSHNVFIDKIHYDGYSHIIAIVYVNKEGKEVWLPIIDKNGQPSYYNYGTNWRKMSFDTNSANIDKNKLNDGVRDFTAFWAFRNDVNLNNAKFVIKVKKLDAPKGWEKDFLNKQIAKPWIDGGYIIWKDNKFESSIKNIESL